MRRLIALLLAAAAALTGCSALSSAGDGYERVSPEAAMALMKSEADCIILDVRTEAEYAGGHIPGAICVPNETIGDGRPEALPDLNRLILVYCRSGNRSRQAAEKLVRLGYTRVVEFGGIINWPGEVTTD